MDGQIDTNRQHATDPRASHNTQAFLDDLAAGRAIDVPVALVVAHPDDETLGVGMRMACLHRLTLIHLTDGALFTDVWSVAAQRAGELDRALTVLGVTPERRIAYGCADQETVAYLPELATVLADDLADTAIVLTHAYEHGHPDHDTAALAVHAACVKLARAGNAPEVVEFPSYHLAREGAHFGEFWPDPDKPEWIARLDAGERERKQAALACFSSQQAMLRNFPLDAERFRLAPDYDFSVPAPPRAAWYDRQRWNIDSRGWRQLARRGMRQLGLLPCNRGTTAQSATAPGNPRREAPRP